MYDLFDHVRYRGKDAVIVTKHEDGSVNVVFGTEYSENSEGIWPVEGHTHVDVDDIDPIEPVEAAEDGEEAGEDAPEVTIEGGATDEDVEEAVEDAEDGGEDDDEGEWEEDFDADDFVDRTPMSEVVEDIETGLYDDHLDAIEAAEDEGRDRKGVQGAIDARRDA